MRPARSAILSPLLFTVSAQVLICSKWPSCFSIARVASSIAVTASSVSTALVVFANYQRTGNAEGGLDE